MKHSLKLFLALGLLIVGLVTGACPPERTPPPPSITATYALKDLGETDLDFSKLTRHSTRLTLAPLVNNRGQVVGNTSKGGFITYPGRWTYAPEYDGMTVYFHGVNHQGDLLVTIHRGLESVEWMCWPLRDEAYGAVREHVYTIDPFDEDYYASGISANGMVAGTRKYQEGLFPTSWTACGGMQLLGFLQNYQIKGSTRSVSNNGLVAGLMNVTVDHPPFVWHPVKGLDVMRNYAGILGRGTWIEFTKLAVTDDGVVFGTYWIRHDSNAEKAGNKTPHMAFLWDTKNGEIKKLDLGGMLINAVNKKHILVGSLQERAVIRYGYKDPVTVESLINPNEIEGWQLIEATDINDHGQIVGYGTLQGKTHLFLAEPLP